MDHAHRLLWSRENGPVPTGYDLHHTCENKLCVNPEHLELLSPKDHHKRHGRLDWDEIAEVAAYIEAGETQTQIAKWFGVSQVRISQVKRRDLGYPKLNAGRRVKTT